MSVLCCTMKINHRTLNLTFTIFLVIAILGFYPTYFSRDLSKFNFWIHIHTIFMMGWFLLLFIQTYLYKTKKLHLHRKVGRFSVVVVALIVFTSVKLIFNFTEHAIERGQGLTVSGFFTFPMTDILLFFLMYVLAIVYRKNLPRHLVFIILATITLLPAAIIRILLNYLSDFEVIGNFPIVTLLIDCLILLFLQVKRRQIRDLNLCFCIAFIFPVVHLVRLSLQFFEPWQYFMLGLLKQYL